MNTPLSVFLWGVPESGPPSSGKSSGSGSVGGLRGGWALPTGRLSVSQPRVPPPCRLERAEANRGRGSSADFLVRTTATSVGGAGPDSVISVHVPERRRARRCLGLSTTRPSSFRSCLALKDRMRLRGDSSPEAVDQEESQLTAEERIAQARAEQESEEDSFFPTAPL